MTGKELKNAIVIILQKCFNTINKGIKFTCIIKGT